MSFYKATKASVTCLMNILYSEVGIVGADRIPSEH